MSENPILDFDMLQQLLDAVAELPGAGALRDEITGAQDALDSLVRWCDGESMAAAENFRLWQRAQAENDALIAKIETLEADNGLLTAAAHALDRVVAELDIDDEF